MPEKKTEYRHSAQGRPVEGHAVHDVGGLDFGAIDREEHDLAFWERRVDAMIVLLATKKGAFKIDAMRRVIESYGEQQYDATGYHEKWVRALRNLIIEQGIISRAELEAQLPKSRVAIREAGRDVADGEVPWNEGLWTPETAAS